MATASELAKQWREERLEFNDALVQHLEGNLGLTPTPALVVAIELAISWANMGLSDVALDLPGHPQMGAGEIVERFGLEAFLEGESNG